MNYRKPLAALIAVAIALLGVFSGQKWLTVLALALWGIAMLVFGLGKRPRRGPPPPESL